MKKILLCSNHKSIENRDVVESLLKANGHSVTSIDDSLDLITLALQSEYDLIATNFDLKKVGIFEVAEILYNANVPTKLIVIADSNGCMIEEEKKLLDLGVCHFLRKGLVDDELIAKYIEMSLTQIILPKPIKTYKNQIEQITPEVVIDFRKMEVTYNGEVINVPTKEYDLLLFFLKNREKPLTREVILQNVWNNAKDERSNRVIDSTIKNLRKRLQLQNIVSIHKVGYKWVN